MKCKIWKKPDNLEFNGDPIICGFGAIVHNEFWAIFASYSGPIAICDSHAVCSECSIGGLQRIASFV